MRILVLDESRILQWVVGQLVPAGIEVEPADSFPYAVELLQERPPDAAVVCLSQATLPWNELQRLCADHSPPIPVLYCSCIHATAADAGVQHNAGYADFAAKPMHKEVLKTKLCRLLEESERLATAESVVC